MNKYFLLFVMLFVGVPLFSMDGSDGVWEVVTEVDAFEDTLQRVKSCITEDIFLACPEWVCGTLDDQYEMKDCFKEVYRYYLVPAFGKVSPKIRKHGFCSSPQEMEIVKVIYSIVWLKVFYELALFDTWSVIEKSSEAAATKSFVEVIRKKVGNEESNQAMRLVEELFNRVLTSINRKQRQRLCDSLIAQGCKWYGSML